MLIWEKGEALYTVGIRETLIKEIAYPKDMAMEQAHSSRKYGVQGVSKAICESVKPGPCSHSLLATDTVLGALHPAVAAPLGPSQTQVSVRGPVHPQ